MSHSLYRFCVVFIAVVCCAFAESSTLDAQEPPSLVVSVGTNPVGVGERFQVSFSANAQVTKFRAPSFDGFMVLSGPNQATSIQYINGSMTQTIAFSYILQAKSEGKFTIQAASADVGGKTVQSQPVIVQVVKATPQSQQQAQQRASEEAAELAARKQVEKWVYLKVSTNKTSVMRGEPLTATYKLYTRLSLVNYTPRKVPALTGFWSQDIGDQQQLTFADEVIGGQLFRVATVKKVLLFPQQSGSLELDPIESEVVARVKTQSRSNNPFDAFFGNDPFGDPFGAVQDVKVTIKSNPVKITVRPLPQTNVPGEFTGIVGSNLKLDATLSQRATKTNEPVKYRLTLTGKGNLKLIDPIKLTVPPDIEVYDPNVTDNVTVTESGAAGSKTFEYLLMPRYVGEYKLPAATIAYLDLDQKRYLTLSTPEFSLSVEKGKDDTPVVAGNTNLTKENVLAIGSDIRFIKSPPERLTRRGDGFFGSMAFFVSLALPPVLFFGFIVYRRKTEELRSNIALMRTRGATGIAKKRLKKAKTFLAQNDHNTFHDEVAKALWGYMSDKLSIPPAALTRETVSQALMQRGVSQGVVQEFALTLDTCEFARFAPKKDAGAMEHLYDDAIQIISNIEREIKA